MVDSPIGTTQRIAARGIAERDLKCALSGVQESSGVAPCLPAFKDFAVALLDAEAEQLFALGENRTRFLALLAGAARRIVEDITPARGLDVTWADMPDELKEVPIGRDADTGLLWECKPDGLKGRSIEEIKKALGPLNDKHPAVPPEVSIEEFKKLEILRWPDKTLGLPRSQACGFHARHGDWERFAPPWAWFLLRFPRHRTSVRAVLSQALQQGIHYWAGQFPSRSKGGETAPIRNSRLKSTVSSPLAVRRMEAYLTSNGIGLAEFALKAGTTDRTLRAFRKTGLVRRNIFDAIATAMGTTRAALLNPDNSAE